MKCCICGFDMVWRHTGTTHCDELGEYLGNSVRAYGYRGEEDEGHVAGIDHSRCCDWCNSLYETPARLGLTGQRREFMGRSLIIATEISVNDYEKKILGYEKKKRGESDE